MLSGTTYFNSTPTPNAKVGYMYGSTSSGVTYAATHTNTNPSAIKTKLDTWYSSNLETNYGKYIADSGFCNDRSLYSGTGVYTSSTYYGGYNRISISLTPQLLCPNASNDLFTTSASAKGNKVLTKPIGLITSDETIYAGMRHASSNQTSYLYNGASYWTMTPYRYYSGAQMFAMNSVGQLMSYTVTQSSMYARPVINLKANVVLSDTLPSGCSVMNGTSSCPYVIDTVDELKEVKNKGYTVTVIPMIYKKGSTTSVLSSNSQIAMSATKQTVTSGSGATFSYGTVASYPYHSFKCNSSNVTQATGGATSNTPIAGTLTATNVTSDITCHLYFQSILLSDA